MTKLKWDETGTRRFETGVDRGVLYKTDGIGVPWNGLTSVEEDPGDVTITSYYTDGVKYLDIKSLSNFAARLNAFTYPDEFLKFDGIVSLSHGLLVGDQPVRDRFGLSWRTRVGNDLDGPNHGYKIHIAYNLIATQSSKNYQTISDEVDPIEFSWDITGVPPVVSGFRPTAHITIDSTAIDASILAEIEDILYGTITDEPRIPTISELRVLIDGDTTPVNFLIIIDNGDGTWSAEGSSDVVTEITPTTYDITADSAVFLDEDTFEISTT